ncbi:nickel ABC transporter substrate-binding protein [Helicobacter sp.]|uniref:nickel ABC transporter substrate-binding protein n=1 Tax=Helicobacter sp. TaxID=218 RepID=UPI0025BA3DA1|nr:nickel ABC transporter substrate-binding protein [Helicobacter sp.]MCI5968467.1 nickel ABC transporter substrate-binding protein [Helicobacter sp.]MDY2585252.1 nickel ABC transporter substrate-binding protein [Helicobacter sp.]
MLKVFLCLLSCISFGFATQIVGAWPSNAGKINPHLYSPNELYAQIMVYQSLVRYEKGEAKPQVAEKWEISPDGKIYTFTIKENLKFSDGSPLDAYAIEKNFDAILENKEEHSWLGITNKIVSAKAKDSKTFILVLNSPYIATLNELSLPRPYRFISPNAMINGSTKDGILAPIGSGVWKLEKSILGVQDEFILNSHYTGKKPEISKFIMKVLPDANARVLALKGGSVDILVGKDAVSRENYKHFSQNPKFAVVASKPQGTFHIAINASKDRTTQDINLRETIIYGVDRDKIWERILLKIDKQAFTLFDADVPYCNVDLSPRKYDRQKAKEILPSDVKELEFVYIANDPLQKAVAEVVQSDLSKVGIPIKLNATESISFYNKQTNGDFDLIFNETWGSPFDPHSFISSMLIPTHADYAIQKDLEQKPAINQAIRTILDSADTQIIQENYKILLETLEKGAVYLPISYGSVLGIYNKEKIKSYSLGEMEWEFLFEEMELP